jgi:hypothetical protein
LTSNRKIEPVESRTAKLPPDGVRTSTSAPSATALTRSALASASATGRRRKREAFM